MADDLDSLILDLLEWVGPGSRPYDEVMDAWRTSCPRLPVWEEAGNRGFLDRRFVPGEGRFVSVSATGAEFVRRHRDDPVRSGRPAVQDLAPAVGAQRVVGGGVRRDARHHGGCTRVAPAATATGSALRRRAGAG